MKDDVVHLAIKHAVTKKFGTWATPLEQVSSACQVRWSVRPRRTRLPSLVDCEACRLYIAAHKLPENWAFV
jgi:hypothetical protein